MEGVAVALIAAVPLTITAAAAWRNAGKAMKVARTPDPRFDTSNGKTIGFMVEQNWLLMQDLSKEMKAHASDRDAHCLLGRD